MWYPTLHGVGVMIISFISMWRCGIKLHLPVVQFKETAYTKSYFMIFFLFRVSILSLYTYHKEEYIYNESI